MPVVAIKIIRKISFRLFIIIFTLVIFHSNSNANNEIKASATEKVYAKETLPVEIDSFVRYMPSRSVKSLSGKIGVTEAVSEYSYEFKAYGKLPVKFMLSPDYFSINNSTEVQLPAHLTGLIFGMDVTLPFLEFDQAHIRFGIRPGFYTDSWNISSSSFRIPAHSFFIYEPDKKWTLIAGVAAYPGFEKKFFPILGFIYKPNDKLTFNIIPKDTNVSYLLSEKVSLFAKYGSLLNAEFEVTKGDLKNVVLKYNETRIGAGVKYRFNKYLESSVSAGGVFNRYLKYLDSLGKVSMKNGLYTELRIDIRI